MKPEAVIFDLGKVLLHFDWMRAAQKLAPCSRVPAEEMLKSLDHSQLLIDYETGRLSSREFFQRAREIIGFSGTFEEFTPLFSDIFSEIPALIELHAELRRRGIRTYILSNTNELAVEHIRIHYPFFAHFDGYVYSYEHQSMKPEPKLYEVAEQMSGCRGAQLLYIDDLPRNTDAGKARGWQVILQEDPAKTVAAVRQTGLLD